MLKKYALKRIKNLQIVRNCIENSDRYNLLNYPGWEKTMQHQVDDLRVKIINLHIAVLAAFFNVENEVKP